MAEVKNEVESSSSNTTFPWQMDWGRSSPPSSPQRGIRAGAKQFPWQMDWGRLPSESLPDALYPQDYDSKFETVFQKLIQAESRGRHRDSTGGLTTSHKGARGITQVMRKTGIDPGYGVTPLQDESEEEFIRFGREYLQAMLNEFDGDYEKALAAYNAGPGNVKKAVARAEEKGGNWMKFLPKQTETVPYVKKILGEK